MNGYSLDDIGRLARTAALSSRFMMAAGDMAYRVDLAWSAIVEELCRSQETPHPQQLVNAGQSEIGREIYHLRRNSGHDPSGRLEWAPQFWAYWESLPRGGPESAVVDRVSLHQIWWHLTPDHRAVLEALSLHDSQDVAAASLGMSRVQFINKLRRARASFFELWHEGETPSSIWRKTLRGKRQSRCKRDHELSDDNVLWRGKPGNRTRICKACSNESKRRYKARQAMALDDVARTATARMSPVQALRDGSGT